MVLGVAGATHPQRAQALLELVVGDRLSLAVAVFERAEHEEHSCIGEQGPGNLDRLIGQPRRFGRMGGGRRVQADGQRLERQVFDMAWRAIVLPLTVGVRIEVEVDQRCPRHKVRRVDRPQDLHQTPLGRRNSGLDVRLGGQPSCSELCMLLRSGGVAHMSETTALSVPAKWEIQNFDLSRPRRPTTGLLLSPLLLLRRHDCLAHSLPAHPDKTREILSNPDGLKEEVTPLGTGVVKPRLDTPTEIGIGATPAHFAVQFGAIRPASLPRPAHQGKRPKTSASCNGTATIPSEVRGKPPKVPQKPSNQFPRSDTVIAIFSRQPPGDGSRLIMLGSTYPHFFPHGRRHLAGLCWGGPPSARK